MEGKLSSPSSSSKGSSNHTPPKPAIGSRDDKNYLVIRKQAPSYVFNEEQFDLVIGLELSGQRGSPPGGTEVEISASLRIHSTEDPSSEVDAQELASLIIVNKDNNNVSTTSPCKLKCKIQMKQDLHRDKRVVFSILVSTRNSNLGISPAYSAPIQLVNYKLRIAIDSTWTNIWYKDEGGRDKSMEATAELYNKDNEQHRERVPLSLTLYYAPNADDHDPVKVSNQEILRLLGSSSKLSTDKTSGRATIRFRIEDVSKNHQGQDFVLRIAPDARKGFFDIAPGFTPSVSVRSKRNKRTRAGSVQGRPEKRTSPSEHSESGSARGYGEVSSRNVFGTESVSAADPHRLLGAMQGVMHWAEEVVNGLYPLQWQVLGYGQHPDGSPDYGRPHYSMTNPNACISRVLSMYSESVRENLWILSQAVEQAASTYQHPANRDPFMHRPSDDSYPVPSAHRGPLHPSMPPPPNTGSAMVPPPPGILVQGGMHPSIASEAFRPKAAMGGDHQHSQPLSQHSTLPFSSPHGHTFPHYHPPMPHQFYRRQVPTQARRTVDDNETAFTPEPLSPSNVRTAGETASPAAHVGEQKRMAQPSYQGGDNDSNRESEVEYVLAKQYKALRTGERLGFPAYSASKEILGFYSESGSKVGVGEFIPIARRAQDFGPLEIMQASEILQDAIAKKSSAVYALKDWGTISNLIDHALVYEWTNDIGSAPGGPSNSRSGSEGE